MKKLKLLGLILILGLITNSCGKEEEDSDTKAVSISNSPGTPVVIESDFTYTLYYETDADGNVTPVQETVTGPWFEVDLNITNGSIHNLIIMGVKMLAYGTKRGETAVISSTGEWQPANMSNNLDNNTGNDTTYIIALTPGQQGVLGTLLADSLPALVDPLEPGDTNFSTTKIVYTVLMEVSGYFTTVSDPTQPLKGFNKVIRFRAER